MEKIQYSQDDKIHLPVVNVSQDAPVYPDGHVQ